MPTSVNQVIQDDVSQMLPKLWQVRGWDRPGVPCNFPCSLMRNDMERLRRYKYSVGPKADGERAFMLFCFVDAGGYDEDYVAVVDRAGRARVVNVRAPSNLYSGTLLDGEMVTDPKTGVATYLVFDIITNGGMPMNSKSHSNRVSVLKEVVSSLKVGDPNLHVRPKPWFRYGEVTREQVMNSISPIPCDGLVFVPEEGRPLKVGRQSDHFKWKHGTDHTIDFVVHGGELWTETKGVRIPISTLGLSGTGKGYSDGVVVECMIVGGVTSVVRTRPDKVAPNDAEIARLTLRNISERITIDELLG